MSRFRYAALVVAVALAVGGCQAEQRTSSTSPASISGTPAPPVTRTVLDVLRGLPVNDQPPVPDEDENRPADVTYNRDRDWQPAGWGPPDGEGCNVRERVLRRDAVPGSVTLGRGCDPTGRWPKVYVDGEVAGRPGQAIQIDHVVSLSDAWRSGGYRWFNRSAATHAEATAKMRAFTLNEANLRAVDGPTNGRKGDRGPGGWQPPRAAAGCGYATQYVMVKAAWGLTVTSRDRDALGHLLDTCP